MWVSRSFERLSSRTRALFGRLRGVSDSADCEDDDYMALDAPRGLDSEGFETVSVNTGTEQVDIFVSKPSEAAYFDHEEAYEPLIVGAPRPDTAVDDIVEPMAKREKVSAGEPADLFINALRRPPYQKFDSSTPVIIKKAAAEPAPIEVEPVIEQIVFKEEELAEATPAVVSPEVPADEVETVIEDIVIAEPAAVAEPVAEEVLEIPVINIPAPVTEEPDPVLFEALEVDDSRVECEISHEAMEQVYAPAVQKFEIGDEVFDMSCLDVEEAPYIAAQKFEIGDEVFDMSCLDVEEAAYVAPQPAVTAFEIGDEVFDMSCLDVEEAAYVAPQPAVEKFEIGDETFDMAFMDVEETPVSEPVLALPSPRAVVRSLPAKIQVEELEKDEDSDTALAADIYSCMEWAETSAGTVETKKSEEFTVEQVAPLPAVIVNEDRDVLFAFRSDLADDEEEFILTSYDDNLAPREDYLDKTECSFKFRAKIERPRFNGDLRSLYSY